MSTISERILEIEKKIDPTSFCFGSENVWPIIRTSIYLSSTKSTSGGASKWKSLRFLMAGALQYGLRIVKNIFPKQYDSILVTTSHYKVLENGTTYDKIIDPVIQYLKEKKIAFSVWEFTGKFRYDDNISYRDFMRPIQQEFYFLSSIRKLLPGKRKVTLKGEVEKLNSLLAESEINFRINGSFLSKLETIFHQATYFEKALRRHYVRNVFLVCYYDVKCFSFLLAANRIGIRSIDLQHGVQGKNHMAYAFWPAQVVANTRFLPTHFYVWDDNSKRTIDHWKKDDSKILLGTNKWFADRAKKVSNKLILLTLQPLDDYFSERIITIMKNYKGDKTWAIRLHPRQLGDISKIENLLEKEGLTAKAEVRNASLNPLTSLLEQAVIHITAFSSVALEAVYFNTPTYFLGEEYLTHYVNYLSDDMMYYYPKHDLNVVIPAVEATQLKSSVQNDKSLSVLDQFVYGE